MGLSSLDQHLCFNCRLTPDAVCITVHCDYQRTILPNRLSALLRAARDRTSAPIRGLAGLLPGGGAVSRGGTKLRLLAGGVPRAVPRLSPWPVAGLLRNGACRSARTARDEPPPRPDRGVA